MNRHTINTSPTCTQKLDAADALHVADAEYTATPVDGLLVAAVVVAVMVESERERAAAVAMSVYSCNRDNVQIRGKGANFVRDSMAPKTVSLFTNVTLAAAGALVDRRLAQMVSRARINEMGSDETDA
jgi:hypothetical protein